MSVVVDTSVWSLAFRRMSVQETPPVKKLRQLLQKGETIFLIGLILQELLQGLRNTKDFKRLEEKLKCFSLIETERKDCVSGARLRNHCAAKGIQAGTVDFLIAAVCIRHQCSLLTTDKDFQRIAKHSRLKLI